MSLQNSLDGLTEELRRRRREAQTGFGSEAGSPTSYGTSGSGGDTSPYYHHEEDECEHHHCDDHHCDDHHDEGCCDGSSND